MVSGDKFQMIKDIHLFARKLTFKVLYDKPSTDSQTFSFEQRKYDADEIQAIEDLMELWEEGHTDVGAFIDPPSVGICASFVAFPPPPSYKPRSLNFPVLSENASIWSFVEQITKEIEKLDFSSENPTNSLAYNQKVALKSLQNNSQIIIKPAGKGGIVVVINTTDYETMCL